MIHIRLMNRLGESRFGMDSRDLLDSALARPQNSAVYENSDTIHQAATMCFGQIKNHPWRGRNKRTATTLMIRFLELNCWRQNWTIPEQIEMVLAVEADVWNVAEIENWLRARVVKIEN